ncbi:hypothetical protein FHS66_000778 [Pacificitalea manganoxidans]|nr:hypothetical protein [Pacificitalea manganoxidans]
MTINVTAFHMAVTRTIGTPFAHHSPNKVISRAIGRCGGVAPIRQRPARDGPY